MQTILEKLVDSRILTILETINSNYPDKFAKKDIDKEIIYIKEHILWKQQELQINKEKIKKEKKKKKKKIKLKLKFKASIQDTNQIHNQTHNETNDLNQCSGRVWSNYIINKINMKQLNDIDEKFKVEDFIDIDIKEFNSKYIIGTRCSKKTYNTNKYCKLHLNHLIHGDYLESPNKELCYHFMKDGKYL
jgi:hypothetical protein